MNAEVIQRILAPDMVGGLPVGIPDFAGFSIDSRTIRRHEIFFAMIGEKSDGHDYVAQAFAKGAAAAVVSRSQLSRFAAGTFGPIYAVDDTHEALLTLAAYIRQRMDARFAAVTGSNGKTTTKEMFYAIVRVRHAAFRSPGNLNNLFGLPISLSIMPDNAAYAIFELGISVPGEMTRLASVIKPELALITNIGPTHLETLKTVDNVVKAKFELIDNLPAGSTVILNGDDPLLMAEAKRRGLSFIGYGIDSDCRFRARQVSISSESGVAFTVDNQRVTIPVFGRVNVYNALGAIAASSVWGCQPDEWAAGLADFHPIDMRLEFERYEGLYILIDCYNANPASVTTSLQSLRDVDVPGRRIVILGDMLELGESSADFHYRIGEEAARSGVDMLFCLGPESRHIVEGAVAAGMDAHAVFHFTGHQELLNKLLALIARGDLILCKGSRGMELEKIIIGLKGAAFKRN